MTTEEKYNLLESQSKGLFSQLMTFAAKRHFLDNNSLVDILDDDEINKLTPEEQKILSEYIDDYVKYKNGRKKYSKLLNLPNGIEIIEADEALKSDFCEISDILSQDSMSKFMKENTGQKIMLSLVYSKSLFEILQKIYSQQYHNIKNYFALKMDSFKENYRKKRLNQLHFNTIKDSEVQRLNEDFYKLGGDELLVLCNLQFQDVINDLSKIDDLMLTISGNFERNFDFFNGKPNYYIEYLNSIDIYEFIQKEDEIFKKNWKGFISRHLTKIFYVKELQNHIHSITNYQEEPLIKEATEYTLKRQIIAISLLLKYAGLDFNAIDNVEIVKFIRFLTKIGMNQTDIKKTTIYKIYPKVELKKDNEDLRYVLEQFRKLKLNIT